MARNGRLEIHPEASGDLGAEISAQRHRSTLPKPASNNRWCCSLARSEEEFFAGGCEFFGGSARALWRCYLESCHMPQVATHRGPLITSALAPSPAPAGLEPRREVEGAEDVRLWLGTGHILLPVRRRPPSRVEIELSSETAGAHARQPARGPADKEADDIDFACGRNVHTRARFNRSLGLAPIRSASAPALAPTLDPLRLAWAGGSE